MGCGQSRLTRRGQPDSTSDSDPEPIDGGARFRMQFRLRTKRGWGGSESLGRAVVPRHMERCLLTVHVFQGLFRRRTNVLSGKALSMVLSSTMMAVHHLH